MRALTSALAAGSLIGGYAVARSSGRRESGGVVLAVGGALCAAQWRQSAGSVRASAAVAVYLGAFAVSHPLAKKIGAWPSVLSMAGATGVLTYALTPPRA